MTLALTPNAARRIRALAEKEGLPSIMLRLSVDSGGCNGFQYKFDLEKKAPGADDTVVDFEGSKLVVDTLSLEFLNGATVDFISDLSGESFQIKNPNADSSCGCGTSFSVKI
jgi:iron-sulfur cluster insertion protein